MAGASCTSVAGCAAGSGGSILINVGEAFSGASTGVLNVNGGSGSTLSSGGFIGAGGGGGRIAVHASSFLYLGTRTAFGGSGVVLVLYILSWALMLGNFCFILFLFLVILF